MRVKIQLTPNQYKVQQAIQELDAAQPWSMSLREIEHRAGLSYSTTHRAVEILEQLGFIRRTEGRYRSLELLRKLPRQRSGQ